MIAVGDLGAVLRWVGLQPGPPPALRRLVGADSLLGEIVDYLRIRFDGHADRVLSAVAEIQFAVTEWYPTWPVVSRLTEIATTTGNSVDAALLAPIAIASELDLPLATTSNEIATIARPHVPSVVLL